MTCSSVPRVSSVPLCAAPEVSPAAAAEVSPAVLVPSGWLSAGASAGPARKVSALALIDTLSSEYEPYLPFESPVTPAAKVSEVLVVVVLSPVVY